MKNIDIKLIKNAFKKYMVLLIVWISLIGVALGFVITGIYEANKEVKFTYLNDLILEDDNKLKNSYLNVHTSPFVFAEYENEANKFYIVKDSEYLYIVNLNDELYNTITSISDIENNPYRIEGYTEEISEDIKKLAIEAYNEAFEEEIINEDNFESYFGSIYLNTNGLHNNASIWYIFAILVGLVGISGVYGIAKISKKSKKVLNKLKNNDIKKLAKELEDNDVKTFKNKLYLTKNYIVALVNFIDIIKYNEIVWYFKNEVRTNGIITNNSVVVVTKDGERHVIVLLTNTKKSKIIIDDVMKCLKKKMPNVIVGYTEKNIKKVQEVYNIK